VNVTGKRIIALLEQKNMLQKELAQKIEVTEVTISRYINGDRVPHSAVLSKMAEALQTTTDYLLGNDIKNNLAAESYLDNRLRQIIYGRSDEENDLLKKVLELPEKDKRLVSEIVDRLRKGKDGI
jgi:transcriptional regulator with XRE-family HTH domain